MHLWLSPVDGELFVYVDMILRRIFIADWIELVTRFFQFVTPGKGASGYDLSRALWTWSLTGKNSWYAGEIPHGEVFSGEL